MTDNAFLMLIRQALLMMVDAIERKLGLKRTAQIRCHEKEEGIAEPNKTGV